MVSVTIDRRDGLNSAAAIKGPCRVATTANITLSGLQTVDGVALAEGDRVLVKNQTDARDNGIRIASTGNWERSADFRNSRDIVTGTQVYITHGTTSANRWYGVTAANPISVGTTNMTFAVSDNLTTINTILDQAESARDEAVSAQAAAEAAAASINLPAVLTPDTILVTNAAGTARVDEDFDTVRGLLGLRRGPLHTPHVSPMLLDYEHHYGLNTCLFPRTDGGLTVVTRQAPTHFGDNDAIIVAWETYDKGLRRENPRIIYSGASTDDRNFASAVMGSRFGVMAMRTGDTPMFLYNDAQGSGIWSAIALTLDAGLPGGYVCSPHGKIMRWPASAGGHDTDGWICYFYGSELITYTTTVTNGSAWTPVKQCIDGTGLAPTEMAVTRVGTEDKWIMICRKETAASYAMMATSTNMTTWTALSATGIMMARNPPYLVQDGSKAWLYTANRRWNEITGQSPNTILVSRIDSSVFYSTAGASGFGTWETVAQLPDWGTGYLDFVEYGGEWIAAFNAGELSLDGDPNGAASALYMISNTPSAEGLAVLRAAAQHQSSLLNSYMQIWQSGTSGTGVAGRMLTADGWGVRRTGSVTGHEWSRQSADDGGYSLRVGRTAGNTSTAAINLINVIGKDDVRDLRGRFCNISPRAKRGADFSAASGHLIVTVFAHTTESLVTATDGSVPGMVTLRTLTIALEPGGKWTDDDSEVYIPKDASMVWVRVSYTPVGTAGAADYFDLRWCPIVPTPYRQPRNPRSYGDELALCQRYFCKTYASDVAIGTVTAEGALQNRARGTEALAAVNMDWRFPQEMRSLPSVTVYSPVTGASGKVADITATADINGTAENVGRSGATLVNSAATTSSNTYRAHAVAASLPW